MPSDTFTNSDGTTLPTHDANWVTPSPSGPTACEISSNTAVGNGAGFSCNYWNATFAEAHYSRATLANPLGVQMYGCAVRIQATGNSCYYALHDGVGGLTFAGEMVSGTPTDWDSGQAGFAAGDIVELEIDPDVTTTVYLKKNGAIVQTYTSKNALSGGRAGVCGFFDGSGNAGVTSWEGDDVAGDPPISDAPEKLRVVRSGIRLQ